MKNIFIAIIVIVMLPLLFVSINNSGDSGNQELKGFSARDIQYLEATGFVNNHDGSFTITLSSLISQNSFYVFDYQGISSTGFYITHFKTNGGTQAFVIYYNANITILNGGTFTIWGGDVS